MDMRSYRRRSERRLIIIIALFLLVVGSVTIGLIYGWAALFSGLVCLLPGAAVVLLLWLLLSGLEWLNRR